MDSACGSPKLSTHYPFFIIFSYYIYLYLLNLVYNHLLFFVQHYLVLYIVKLANYFNVSADYLLCISNKPNLNKIKNTYAYDYFNDKNLNVNNFKVQDNYSMNFNFTLYNKLNDTGQQKVNDYIKDLVNTKEYNKKKK